MHPAKENKSYVTAEYLKKRAQTDQAINAESHQMLQIGKGMKILNVGCGPNTDAAAFFEAVGTGGVVVGVDCDPKMLQQANAATKQYANVWHSVGDAHRLPFGDATFDRIYARRLLQVLPPASAPVVFSELWRVLKPGGVVVVMDTDWTSVSINFSNLELERRLTGFFRDHMRPNGLAGRQLLELAHLSGFTDWQTKVVSIAIQEFAESPFGDWLIVEATKAKVATPEELSQWRTELEQKSAQGTLLFHCGTVIVSAQKREQP